MLSELWRIRTQNLVARFAQRHLWLSAITLARSAARRHTEVLRNLDQVDRVEERNAERNTGHESADFVAVGLKHRRSMVAGVRQTRPNKLHLVGTRNRYGTACA